jgi:PPM family protein phosphatase
MKSIVTIGSLADVGKRDHQEDAYGYKPFAKLIACERAQGQLFVVADGVGGQQAGEVASRMAVEIILRQFYAARGDAVESLRLALLAANQGVYTTAHEMGHEKMATTAVCAVIRDQELIVGHVGDSRAYLRRGDQLQQLTVDHSWVAEQVSAGTLSADAALSHPFRNLITRSLGNRPDVVPEIRRLDSLANGDRIMLCTDGLYDGVSDAKIAEVLKQRAPKDACQELVRLANEAGGTDNITVMVLDIQLIPDGDEAPKLLEDDRVTYAPESDAVASNQTKALMPGSTAERSGESKVSVSLVPFTPPRSGESAPVEALDRRSLQPAAISEAIPPAGGPELPVSSPKQHVREASRRVAFSPGTGLFDELGCEISWNFQPAIKESYEIRERLTLPDGRCVTCELRVPAEPSPPSRQRTLQISVNDGLDQEVIVLLPRGQAKQRNQSHPGRMPAVIVDDDTSLFPFSLGNTQICVDVTQVKYHTPEAQQFRGLTVRFRIQVPIATNMADRIGTN